jgi:hypothetical protein
VVVCGQADDFERAGSFRGNCLAYRDGYIQYLDEVNKPEFEEERRQIGVAGGRFAEC